MEITRTNIWNELSDDFKSLTSMKALKGYEIKHNFNNVNSQFKFLIM